MGRFGLYGFLSASLALVGAARAAAVDASAFGPGAVVQNFSSLAIGTHPASLTLDGVTYSTDAANFNAQSIFNSTSKSLFTPFPATAQRSIDVTFATPVDMAGLSVGSTQTYLATVTFFDAASTQLGVVSIPFTAGGDLRFAGWDSDGAPIARIRAFVTTSSPTRITDVISQVPEPGSASLLLAGAAFLLARRRRRG